MIATLMIMFFGDATAAIDLYAPIGAPVVTSTERMVDEGIRQDLLPTWMNATWTTPDRLREYAQPLVACPPLFWAEALPPTSVIQDAIMANRDRLREVEAFALLHPEWSEVCKDHIRYLEAAYRVWDIARDARTATYAPDTRRTALAKLDLTIPLPSPVP